MEQRTSPTRRLVERASGLTVSDRIWVYLLREGVVLDWLARRISEAELRDKIQGLLELTGPSMPVRGDSPRMLTGEPGDHPHSARDEALSLLVAKWASENPAVKAFREQALHGLQLEWSQVHTWMLGASKESAKDFNAVWHVDDALISEEDNARVEDVLSRGLEATSITVEGDDVSTSRLGGQLIPLSAFDGVPPFKFAAEAAFVYLHASKRYLMYAAPGDDYERRIETPYNSLLDALRQLSESMAIWYQWSEAQATIFLLTGITPLIAPLKAVADYREDAPALSRIHLTIDPTMSPREVAEEYRRFRQWFVGPRHRDLSDKHTQLALFFVKHPKATEAWADLMALWNQEHPEWAYEDASTFGRDCAQAQRRLMGTDAEPGGR